MEASQTERIPTDIEELRQQLESWRNTHAHRSRIPEALWTSAVKLARQHGLHQTAKALHLDYRKLKTLVGGNSAGKMCYRQQNKVLLDENSPYEHKGTLNCQFQKPRVSGGRKTVGLS